jgi:PAS domain S-box-containing protein
MKLKIFHRGLIFISIPLFFEIFVFSVLINLNEQAESAARRAQKSRLINDQINLIIGDCYQISRITKGISLNGIAPKELEDGGQMEDGKLMPTVLSAAGWVEAYSHYRQAARKYLQDMAQLKLLVADNPENLAIVERSEHAALEADRLIARLRKQIPRTSYSDISKILTENRHQLDALIVQVLSPEVINIAKKEAQQEEEEKNQRMRFLLRNALFGAIGASVVLALSLVVLFSKSLAGRLAKVQENAVLLSQRSPLNPPLQGSDEIAELDRAYQLAATLLSESEQKLQQTFDYAEDLICSLNDSLKVVVANKAWARHLDRTEAEIIGSRIVNLIAANNREIFVEALEQLRRDQREPAKLEVRLAAKDGSLIDTICIARWVDTQKTFFCVFHDISERKRAEEIRRETFAMISHDLRAPVASFANFVEMAEMGVFGLLNEKGAKFVDFATKSVDKMRALLEDILLLEKVKSGATKAIIVEMPVNEVLERVAGPLQVHAHSKQITIQIDPTEAIIRSDPSVVEKILSNFLSNALRISPTGTKIRLYYQSEDNKDILSVEDEGPGLDEEVAEKLFERFYKKDMNDDGNLPSCGLGLTICKELATVLEGTIRVQSKKGDGATFSLVLNDLSKQNAREGAEQIRSSAR